MRNAWHGIFARSVEGRRFLLLYFLCSPKSLEKGVRRKQMQERKIVFLYATNKHSVPNASYLSKLRCIHFRDWFEVRTRLQIVTAKKGRQELWVLTVSFQKYMSGSLSSNETNYRIQAGFVDELVRGTRCDASPSTPSRKPGSYGKWKLWHREHSFDHYRDSFSPTGYSVFARDRFPFHSQKYFRNYDYSRFRDRVLGYDVFVGRRWISIESSLWRNWVCGEIVSSVHGDFDASTFGARDADLCYRSWCCKTVHQI